MAITSKELIEKLSSHCYSEQTLYHFNKTTLQISDRYRIGRLDGLKYLSELTYYYLQEEKRIKNHFRDQILNQMQSNACLADSDYKKGLFDALNDVLDEFVSPEERLTST